MHHRKTRKKETQKKNWFLIFCAFVASDRTVKFEIVRRNFRETNIIRGLHIEVVNKFVKYQRINRRWSAESSCIEREIDRRADRSLRTTILL